MAAAEEFFTAEVRAATRTSAHLVRLVLAGPGLDGFTSTGVPDEWVRIFPPRAGQTRLDPPRRCGAGWEWPAPAPEGRYYTVRDWDPRAGEVLVDVVVHDQGLVTEWAQGDCVGCQVVLSAPRGSFALPADAGWVLLVGDLTALPAISRIAAGLPDGLPARILVETPPGAAEELPAGPDVTWRRHRPTAQSPSRLEEAVRALPWPEGPGYFWMAGEASQMRGIRRYLRHELAWPSASYDVMGYWRFDAERWQRRYDAARIDAAAIWADGERAGKGPAEIWDEYEAALARAGL